MIKESIFRTYDIRGIYPTELNEEAAYSIGLALGTLLSCKNIKNIVVGRDNRESSPSLCKSLIKGLLETGRNITDVGITLTPVIHFYTCTQDFDAGINVTASHNPKEFNGFRIDYRDAYSFYGDDIKNLYRFVKNGTVTEGKGIYKVADLFPRYKNYLKSRFNYESDTKVVIDCGSGASSNIAPQIFDDLGVKTVPIYCHLDSSFPHGVPDPENPLFMDDLEKKVLEEEADVGFALDTDGDRFGVVDEEGRSYSNDKVLLLFADYGVKEIKGKTVVYDVKSSQIVNDYLLEIGAVPKMIRTGHPFFTEEVKKGAVLGAELSGHVFFGDGEYGYDDGMFAACKIVEIMQKSGKKLSELLSKYPKTFNTHEIKATCSDEEKFKIIKEISDKLSKEAYSVIKIDGVRVNITKTGWFLIRASNTSPYLSIRIEGNSKSEAQLMLDTVDSILSVFNVNMDNLKKAEIVYS
ncbi:hypothetical protein A3F07_01065 [candidate division WWE3 bacterium RIFCSPHIGHO2_12_FULL_38_15]|uniref:Phosphomannomutase n=1 Tax=candidate division WWE3 bacterium RIFCSPHIGHO2_02_FULL_38_14 TaxID=1802620 RepID=A0A1F4VAX4_UNCKA|nr:MAG: hypothetical protein A2793_03735 [candidate division WWE3 bacterium RIFCSPHIGHO2_01_FULL_38_45]OGC49165.1 MAG: hypothetical protein A3F07_01065 [candidate division WWE3 bacterium RIFCSPHIGHO2_12_FULL_38_15]OGC52569.1 MAG: hypothetical protein A3B64_03340 [candidate division WWE3 bacterium RIFCSPLOWO2_01_FULL_37_24]OGC54060.1 MAG: hypothetical protein A3D91_04865 [candidate division WWE3 bacterium RIFCSPHIGHO2_02_FULL_38_14]HLB51768.1 phosphomannomutase/phosphoglucomutase [Patescibacteri